MIPKRIIELAIKGGFYCQIHPKTGVPQDDGYSLEWEEIALDPKFWIALSKELQWGSFYDSEGMPRYHVPMLMGWYPDTDKGSGEDEMAWQGVALQAFQLILSGKPLDEFWQSIAPTK